VFVKEKVVYCFVCFSRTLYTLYGAVTAVDFHEECGFHCAVFHETRCHSSEVSCVDFSGNEYYPNRKKVLKIKMKFHAHPKCNSHEIYYET
jgi:hypothetical protein